MGLVRELMHSREGPLLMGVLNRTPDSFSDGGRYLDDRRALEQAEAMLRDGAAIIDVGAESTRPGALLVPADEQLARLGPIVKQLSKLGVPVSVDTTNPEVALQCLADGARMVNSVDPGRTPELARAAARSGADLVIMHSRGSMTEMPGFSSEPEDSYRDIVEEVMRQLQEARDVAEGLGLRRENITLDPGLGFHKSARHSLELCVGLERLTALDCPILVGPSRKSFLAQVTRHEDQEPAGPNDRLGASIAACLLCVQKGASVLRVHDVREVWQALAFHGVASHV